MFNNSRRNNTDSVYLFFSFEFYYRFNRTVSTELRLEFFFSFYIIRINKYYVLTVWDHFCYKTNYFFFFLYPVAYNKKWLWKLKINDSILSIRYHFGLLILQNSVFFFNCKCIFSCFSGIWNGFLKVILFIIYSQPYLYNINNKHYAYTTVDVNFFSGEWKNILLWWGWK